MFLTDSDGNPRSFPKAEIFELEETYPYIIRNQFKDATFWQLSFGNITTGKLVTQPMAYLTHWEPDIIIVQSGIADCRPEGFSDFQKELISRFTWKFFRWIRKYVEHPAWIKHRQLYRVSKSSYRSTLKKFKMTFPKSKILWLEISTGPLYDNFRPGIEKRRAEYNAIIKEVFPDGFVSIYPSMMGVNGFNPIDHGHFNKRGHEVVAKILIERINTILNQTKG